MQLWHYLAFLLQDKNIYRKYSVEWLNPNIPVTFLLFYYSNHPAKVSLTTWNRLRGATTECSFRALSALCLKHPIVNNIFPYNPTLKRPHFLSFLQRHLCFAPLNKTGHSFVTSFYKQHRMHTPDSRHYQQPAKHRNNLGIITGYPKW